MFWRIRDPLGFCQALPIWEEFSTAKKKGGLVKTIRLIAELRITYYDVIVDLRTNLIPLVLRANKNIFKSKRVSTAQHSVEEHYEGILTLDGVTSTPPHCRLYVEDNAKEKARCLIKSLAGKKLLAIGPGANCGYRSRNAL